MTGTMWGPRGQHGVETTETTETTGHLDLLGGYGDDVGTMGTTRG